jgi:adenosylhomocysteine nucleosidase
VGFRAIKGISDGHDFELESLSRFAGPRGSFRTAAFALHTALRPQQWSRAAQLGRDSSRALTALTAALREVIAANGVCGEG